MLDPDNKVVLDFMESEQAPREFHKNNRERGALSDDACDLIATIIHDLKWPAMFDSFRKGHKLSEFASWCFDLLSKHYDEYSTQAEALQMIYKLYSSSFSRSVYKLDLFPTIDNNSHIGITDIPENNFALNQFRRVSFIETAETTVIDRVLCSILDIKIENKNVHPDIIISHARGNPYLLLSEIEDAAEDTFVQIGKDDLLVDTDWLRDLQNKSHEIIQVGPKNEVSLNNYFIIRSIKDGAGTRPALILKYYLSATDFYSKQVRGKWTFRSVNAAEKAHKIRVEAYNIEKVWSFFPSDYILFWQEKSFNVKSVRPDGNLKATYPLFLLSTNLDDVYFIRDSKELSRILRRSRESDIMLYIAGNSRIIPFDSRSLEIILLKGALTLLNSLLSSENPVPRLKHWLPFLAYEGAVNVTSKEEAQYYLVDWIKIHQSDYLKVWEDYLEKWGKEGDAYQHFKLVFDIEEKFPFVMDKSAQTNQRMFIKGWSSDSTVNASRSEDADLKNRRTKTTEAKRECRKQPIRNLMLAALGISREQFKYIQKINQK